MSSDNKRGMFHEGLVPLRLVVSSSRDTGNDTNVFGMVPCKL